MLKNSLTPKMCSDKIFEMTGARVGDEVAVDLWPKIEQHRDFLSERLGRNVGMRVACADLLENFEQAIDENAQKEVLNELGAQIVKKELWDTISDTQPPKQLVQRKIILPLAERSLSEKHGVIPPKSIIFFGPPGTGKTHFARAIAGILSWWLIEIAPSMLMIDGNEKLAANLRIIMEKIRKLQHVVIFIDEFEEIAGSRDDATRIDKSITNEFLKQVQFIKDEKKEILLICATNYIKQLDKALLRPGRFDCIIPVGFLNSLERKSLLIRFLSKLHTDEINLDKISELTLEYTPADMEYLFQKVAHFAFEQELITKKDYRVTENEIIRIISETRPSLSNEAIVGFEEDAISFARF